MQVTQALEDYLTARRSHVVKKTLQEKRRIVGYFAAFCQAKSLQLEDVQPRVIDAYLEHIHATHRGKKSEQLSSHTTFQIVANLKIFLRWCALDESLESCITVRTIDKIPNPRKAQLVKDVFSKSDVQKLLEACKTVKKSNEKLQHYLTARDRLIVLLLLDTGIRAGELCSLKIKQVFLPEDDPHIRIYGAKTRSWREIGLGKRCTQELQSFLDLYRTEAPGDDPVFLSWRGHPLTEDVLLKCIQRLGSLAGIHDVRVSPHTFRHTYAYWCVDAGMDVLRLSRLLGHQSLKVTELYLKAFTSRAARKGAVNPADQLNA